MLVVTKRVDLDLRLLLGLSASSTSINDGSQRGTFIS